MYLACSTVLIVALLTGRDAAGVGKAWEVSPVKSPDHPAHLIPWPRLESSAFEVRSISGVGRLAPSDTLQSPFDRDRTTDAPTVDPEEASLESTTPLREGRELEDLNGGDVYVSEVLLHDPTVNSFIQKTKDVEAVPSLWQKIRRHGRTGRNHGYCSEVEVIGEPPSDRSFETMENDSVEKEIDAVDRALEMMEKEDKPEVAEEKPSRVRREAETEMEKIVTSKNLREARLNSQESWSNQPLSVEFRHQTKLEKAGDEDQAARSSARDLQAPRTDFVTANRRSFTKSRESRDLPLPAVDRSLENMPTYRNTLRDRDLDAPYSRGLFYPDRYRTERDYFVRGLNEPASYPQDRYQESDLDRFGRSRPVPKPKRIIYYATLPEVVRKPVDLRSYPRPYDTLTRSTNPAVTRDAYYKRRITIGEPGGYRYFSYPYGSSYDNYDPYAKRPGWMDHPYDPYMSRMEGARRREQDMDHASMKDASRTEEAMGRDRKMPDRMTSREQDDLLWPVKIGTELTVKDSERISGRKIFGQQDDYDRFRDNPRMDRDRESAGSVENGD